MRASRYLLATEKGIPKDAELISHQLMLRAGLIRKVASGIYSWLPLGLRVLRKVENIVREEMNASGALEVLMPGVIPGELWQETGRWQKYGPELLRLKDRHERDFCLGPTHEEVITDIARREIKSYKDLPLNLYQIQTKFRDEIRPRFGVMRGREFIMKDAYSFHLDEASLRETYEVMFEAYLRIFKRLGLEARAVDADSGAIGGNLTHEFQVLAEAGEDLIFYSDQSDYAANIEKAVSLSPQKPGAATLEKLEIFDTPGARYIADLARDYGISAKQSVKTMIGKNRHNEFFAFILRGDHELNEVKVKNLPMMQTSFSFASPEEIENLFKASPGSLGPVGSPIPVIVDRDAAIISNFVCGANQNDKHYKNVNFDRDVKIYQVFDIRNVVEGDPSPDGKGVLKKARGIEVGHIFQLGKVYAEPMNLKVLNEKGEMTTLEMGCYGLGVTRVVAAAIEQHHDERGIIWPQAMAPFQVVIVPIGYDQSATVREAADKLYRQLQDLKLEVLLDDRAERPGVKFADADLIGITHRIVINEKLLAENQVEYKARSENAPQIVTLEALAALLK